MRQGLKTYSNWPTYPQLYIDGDLIGGLDIVKEMIESGDIQDILPTKVKLEDRLKALINKAPVVIFMKGHPGEPKCGFSRQLMELLKESAPEVKFDTFDIFSDEDVRQGLKTYSNWPTYPQLYVKGELVGGLDIIKELSKTEYVDCIQYPNQYAAVKSGLESSVDKFVATVSAPSYPRHSFVVS